MSESAAGASASRLRRRGSFSVGNFLAGIVTGLCVITALIYGFTLSGGVSLVLHGGAPFAETWYWLVDNLGFSIFAFALVFVLYAGLLLSLRREVERAEPDESRLVALDHRLDLIAGVCFGVGVIFTAIGLRSALLETLGGLDETSARTLGAFNVLRRLVDEGILLALSTTIVGGVAGYAMRVIKNFWLGGQLIDFLRKKGDADQVRVLERLEAIEIAVRETGRERDAERVVDSDC